MHNEGETLKTRHYCEKCGGSDSATTYLSTNLESGKDFLYSICYSDKHEGDDIGFRYVPSETQLIDLGLEGYTDLSKGIKRRERNPRGLYLRGPVPEEKGFRKKYRGITPRTQETYGVFFAKMKNIDYINELGDSQEIAFTDEIGWWYPYYTGPNSDELVAYKVEIIGNKVSDAEEDRPKKKKFTWVKLRSDATRVANLFGSHIDPRIAKNHRAITIVEGEKDAMSCYQMHGSLYPVLSLINGAQTARKLTTNDLKRLEQYNNVYIDLDSDPVAQKEVKRLATLFPQSALIVQKQLKDANEYLERGLADDYVKAWWAAKPYAPDGIIFGSETEKYVEDDEDDDAIGTFPWDGLNEMLEGIFPGQLIMFTAGSGVGKSSIVKEVARENYHEDEDVKQGLCFFEEIIKLTVRDLVGMEIGVNLRSREKRKNTPEKDKKEGWTRLFYAKSQDEERWAFWDHFGSNEIDKVVNNIRYLAVNFGAKIVYVDHITIIVSDQDANGDERRSLDAVMTKLAMLASELGIAIVCVSHLRRPDGKPHEEGGVTSLSQLRGSHSLAQLSHVVIGVERNGQSENPFERNLSTLRVLKNRYLGVTGPAAYILWDNDTSNFEELTYEEVERRRMEVKEDKREIAKEVKKAREEEEAMSEDLEDNL